MKGLSLDFSLPRYALSATAGRIRPSVHYGPLSALKLTSLPSPRLPGPGWARLAPVLTGMCGSDLATIFMKFTPTMQPFSSFPMVLGHEILARVVDPAAGGSFQAGQRVVVNPLLPCRLRKVVPPCAQCAEGNELGCESAAEGCFAAGTMLGFCRDLPGGFSTEFVAHESQLFAVPDNVPDKAAVLVEPLSVAAHSVLRHRPVENGRVLVIGSGPVAFATLWALRALELKCHVTLMTNVPSQVALGRAMGADEVMVRPANVADETRELGRRTHARSYQPMIGPPVLEGGFHQIFDCVGSSESFATALRTTRASGQIVVVGALGELSGVDLTNLWRHELCISGSYVYDMESHAGRRTHTFDVVLGLLARGVGPDPSQLVTHVFGLHQYIQAIEANLDRARSGAMKTVIDPSLQEATP